MIHRAGRHLHLNSVISYGKILAFAAALSAPSLRAQIPHGSASGPGQRTPDTGGIKSGAPNIKPVPLRSQVYLVPIRVVVRDMQGRPIANLRKEDFRILEDGKSQDITYFSVEALSAAPQAFSTGDSAVENASSSAPETTAPASKPATPPVELTPASHFVALLFDDVHATVEDLTQTREAAIHFVDTSLQPADRVSVSTISGQSPLDFTADRDALHAALLHLAPRSVTGNAPIGSRQCPAIDYYQADQIVNQHDQQGTAVAVYEALACAYQDDPRFLDEARRLAMSTAEDVAHAGDVAIRDSFRQLAQVLQDLSTRPGQRSLVLVSPGFISPENQYALADIIDRANRLNIFINALDARGLYTPDFGNAALAKVDNQCGSACTGGWLAARARVRTAGESAQSQVLDALAYGTGGLSFHNNDFSSGFISAASLPEVSYLIAFTPQNPKYDGKFHSLKVMLSGRHDVTVQARRGFYDPKQMISAEELQTQQLQQAVDSQDVQHGVPVELQMRFQKISATAAKVAVLAHLEIGKIQFDKSNGRSDDDLTIVTALFDRDGKMVSGVKKDVQFSLRDDTFQKLRAKGMTVQTDFDVKPGYYFVRLVVLDSNTSRLSAESGIVDMPN